MVVVADEVAAEDVFSSSAAGFLWLALCPPRAWYDPNALPHTEHLYPSDTCLVCCSDGTIIVGIIISGLAAAVLVLILLLLLLLPLLRPLASIRRQKARYSSSDKGESVVAVVVEGGDDISLRDRLERFFLTQ